jgi:hypothetical protein
LYFYFIFGRAVCWLQEFHWPSQPFGKLGEKINHSANLEKKKLTTRQTWRKKNNHSANLEKKKLTTRQTWRKKNNHSANLEKKITTRQTWKKDNHSATPL